jgi:hypothetical protein
MPNDLTIRQQHALSAKLDRLAEGARRAHERAKHCAAKLVENAARSGQFLLKARDLCDNDQWNDFLVHKFKVSDRTAYRYMYIAKHWARLQAIAPPEALSSLRKATQLLNSFLLGEDSPDGAVARSRKKRSKSAPQIPAPVAAPESTMSGEPVAAPADAKHSGLERLYRDMQELLAQLSEELSQLTPPTYQVRRALEAVGRARTGFEQAGRRLFSDAATLTEPEEST